MIFRLIFIALSCAGYFGFRTEETVRRNVSRRIDLVFIILVIGQF